VIARVREWVVRVRGTLRQGRRDADLEEELRAHLALAAEDERRKQPSGQEERAAAIRAGQLTQGMEALRDQRGVPWLADLGRDLQYAVRTLRRNRLFAAVAIGTLALGIGANTAIFSLADAVLLRALPVNRPQDLVMLRQRGPNGDIMPFTSGAAADLASSRDVLSGLAAFRPVLGVHVGVDGETERLLAQFVSGNYHAVLGIDAEIGRLLTEQDRDPVAVISHRYWQRRFSGDPRIVGRTLDVQGRTFVIVGVTPAEFFGTQPGRHVDVTAPLAAKTMGLPPNARWLYLIGRVAPGVSRDQARAALGVRWAQLPDSRPPGRSLGRQLVTLELDPGSQGFNELRRQFSLPLRILMVAVGIVLLLACANLASLLIARSSARRQEIAVRLSLGAARGRIVRQLLTESALLAAVGGAAGAALATVMTGLLLGMMSRGRGAILIDVSVNAGTMIFAAALTLATTVLFGLLPAVAASRTDLQPGLRSAPSGAEVVRSGWGRALVAAQVALLVLLLASAGLFARTLHKLRAVDTGFRQEDVLVVGMSKGPAFRGDRARALYDDLYARFSGLPFVQSVSMSMDTPLAGEMSMGAGITVRGRPADGENAPAIYHNFVGPRFFETMGIAILAGRDFLSSDDQDAPRCVVVSESVARRYFPGDDPLGREILLGNQPASIVGVVKDVRYTSLRTGAPLVVYRPYRQNPDSPADTFLVRTSSTGAAAVPSLQAEVRAAAPGLPLPAIVRLEDIVAARLVEERVLAVLSSAIGLLAAILAAIGVYSTVAASVARRRRELGVRMALGARPAQVVRSVVIEALGIVAAGVAIGVPAALAAGAAARGLLSGLLFEISPSDPLVLACVAIGILSIALLAAYLPARRAAGIDPVAAIKCE
jgi:predicted permease